MPSEASTPSQPSPKKAPKVDSTTSPNSLTHSRLNAFTSMMNPKRKSTPPPSPPRKSKPPFASRDGLGTYIQKPASHPTTRVITYDDSFVTIHDLYPKSSVHTLLLPRSKKHTFLHPFDAFADPEFLSACRIEAEKLKQAVAKELQRIYSKYSAQDAPMEAVLNGDVELADREPMPKGRDWAKEVKVGVHAHPSMNHLHVHVLSVDRFSECMKHRKHYNSFATDFFVPLEDFPLAEDDVRRKQSYLNEDLKCWRCGKNYGNKFARLKEHLAEEFAAWRKE